MAEEFEDWEVSREAQPRPGGYSFDLDAALSSVVTLEATISPDAFTADVLGTERGGNAVQIRDDGVVATIAYLVTEAESVRLTTQTGRTVAGHVLSADQSTGLALIQALEPLGVPAIAIGDSRHARPGEPVIVAGSGGRRRSIASKIVARQEFAGYWEYLIESAIFTAPAHPNWGGAGVIGPAGDLIGIGSLQLAHEGPAGRVQALNMAVPMELLTPVYDDLLAGGHGQAERPWLGLYAQEIEGVVAVMGVSGRGPAKRAGLREGDVIRAAAGMEIANLADLYRSVWAQGAPGVAIPMTLQREGEVFDLSINSVSRRGLLKSRRLH